MNDRAEPVLATTLEPLVEIGTLTRAQAGIVRNDFRTGLLAAAAAAWAVLAALKLVEERTLGTAVAG